MNKRRNMDDEGALEGLPLYLIILVVVAGIGTAIIAGWMMSAQSTELGSMEVVEEDRIISENSGETITIKAYDQDGNPLQGAVVTLEGSGVTKSGQTDSEGECDISNVRAELPSNDNFGTIDVEVSYTGDMTTTRTAVITVEN